MNRPITALSLTFLALLSATGSVPAQTHWMEWITDASISSRSTLEALVERAEERALSGYYCIDVERSGSTWYGVFVRCAAITDGFIYAYQRMPQSAAYDSKWKQIDTEFIGYGMPGEKFYAGVYIETETIQGEGYFARSSRTEFIDRKRESEDLDHYITDFEYIDGSWWAITNRSSGAFSGYATLSSRSSFSSLLTRAGELGADDKRMIDIECIDGTWYGLSVRSDVVGATGLYSRSSFSEFSARTQELEENGSYLIDLEIEGGNFYGVVVHTGL